MKQFDKKIYNIHLSELPKCNDPYSMDCYMKGVLDLANSFNTEEKAAGILDKNDIVQECYFILCRAWENLDWDAIQTADDPQANIWAYLKKTIKIQARDWIHAQKDGIRIPHGKRWEIAETKNVDDFLSQLFPTEFFAENAERMGLYEDDYLVRYDVMQLGIALEDVMLKYLSQKEKLVLELSFGIDHDKLSSKQIAERMNITVSNVDKTKFIAIQKLRNEEVKKYLENFYNIE